ncbi:MAG TPA: HD domain-containing phosphohydrolase [Anaerolineales bacterium]|nr:HD domain-containing phosphohydrolase [Anaerolineales bacterium]
MSTNLMAFEQNQRRQTQTVIIWIALIVCVALGFFDIQFNTWVSVTALFALALLCIPMLFLNSKGYFGISAFLLSCLVLVVITSNLYDGDGVHDPGILAYPMFIMIGTLVFGKRAAPLFALAAIGSVALIVYLQFFNYIHPKIGPTTFGILIPMITLLLAASAIIWVIVNNIDRNLQRARESEAELRKNYDLTLEAWAKVMEYRDRETEGHSRRLVELSTRLARALRVSEEEIVQLQRGALLHDIGKLAIPDDILLKPAALDEDEKKIIQKHPVYAKQMLSGIPFLQPAISVAYSHHEHWDGGGYPEGLKGEEIPMLARIFTVVDTWDALRAERVYRPAWPAEEIVSYLKQNAGIIYDPQIVEVFLGII